MFSIHSKFIAIISLVLFISFQACSDVIKAPVKSQLSTQVLSTENGLNSLLVNGYKDFQNMNYNYYVGLRSWCTDMGWETGGGSNASAIFFINFTWNADNIPQGPSLWKSRYRVILDANEILEHVDNANISEENKREFKAEARFLRAISYYRLWLLFGPVPLRTSTKQPNALARPSEDKFISFVASELKKAISNLPKYDEVKQYGRAQKSAARAFLVKLYLNSKQWEKAANIAKTIIDNGHFKLFPSYPDLFEAKNDRNSEYIWVLQLIASTKGQSNTYMNGAYPPDYQRGLEAFNDKPKAGTQNWAAQYRLRDNFVNSFNPKDQRLKLILKKYITTEGDTVSLAGKDDYRSFKYYDPNAVGTNYGNDIPMIRYADILLSRAEALNELKGPNQTSIDLINKIRNRAGLKDIRLKDFKTKDALRNHIMKERGWEFYSEGHRRMTLIRMGKFISNAHKRGITRAKPYMVRFPIPTAALQANPKLKQNPCY